MNKRIEVTVSLDDKRVTLEGPEDFVREEVERLVAAASEKRGTEPSRAGSPPANNLPIASERETISKKMPSGHSETVAVLAFCLRENGLPEFTADDMRKAYIRAGVRPPKVVAQALRDAKNKYEYITHGTERGKFRLSSHGERTVLFDLPRAGEATKT